MGADHESALTRSPACVAAVLPRGLAEHVRVELGQRLRVVGPNHDAAEIQHASSFRKRTFTIPLWCPVTRPATSSRRTSICMLTSVGTMVVRDAHTAGNEADSQGRTPVAFSRRRGPGAAMTRAMDVL